MSAADDGDGASGAAARPPEPFDVLVDRATQGDKPALEALLPLVYGELRRLAAHYLRGERPGQTLQPTALV
ncbi:MAG: ECF-type sigma factor, partial [Vicinamibacterales bacterium]